MKTFIFDVDDTLYDQTQPFEKAFNTYLKGVYALDIHTLYVRSRVFSDAIFPQVERGEISVDESGAYRITKALEECGITYSPKDAMQFQQAYRYHQAHLTLSNEMVTLFDYLQDKVALGVLTNGVANHQRGKIKGLNLARWIPETHMFVSGDIGASKPDSKAFEYIEKALQNKKEDTYYIGDSISHDIVGAKGFGWKMIFINRRGHDVSKCAYQPDYIVYSEQELIDLLKEIAIK